MDKKTKQRYAHSVFFWNMLVFECMSGIPGKNGWGQNPSSLWLSLHTKVRIPLNPPSEGVQCALPRISSLLFHRRLLPIEDDTGVAVWLVDKAVFWLVQPPRGSSSHILGRPSGKFTKTLLWSTLPFFPHFPYTFFLSPPSSLPSGSAYSRQPLHDNEAQSVQLTKHKKKPNSPALLQSNLNQQQSGCLGL